MPKAEDKWRERWARWIEGALRTWRWGEGNRTLGARDTRLGPARTILGKGLDLELLPGFASTLILGLGCGAPWVRGDFY